MELLLATSLSLCAIAILILLVRNNRLSHERHGLKALHNGAIRERNNWEDKYWEAISYLRIQKAPPSHNAEPVDPDEVISNSDDPVWDIVVECRKAGLFHKWLTLNHDLLYAQPHRRYGEFATWILQLPESRQSVGGVKEVLLRGTQS